MSKHMRAALLLCVAVVLVSVIGCAEHNATESVLDGYKVRRIDVIVDQNGGRVDWSHTDDIIAHSRYGEDGYYDLWTMNPDGSNADCLTCDNPAIPQLHNGQPAWHPSGRWIIFQSQDPSLPHTPELDYAFTQPGHGLHNNLWITVPAGTTFYQLTHIEQGRAVLHPSFSHDGSKLVWSEKVGDDWMDWAIRIADFVETPEPHLENIETYQPAGQVWYEAHGFSVDDSKILCTIAVGTEAYANYDIWEMDIATGELTQLTNTPDEWDEHAHYSPDGEKIVWVSSHGYAYDPESWAQTLKTDLWMMDADGAKKQRITYFNEPGHAEYAGEQVIMSDNAWSADGNKVIALIKRGAGRESAQVVVIQFE